MSTAVQGLAVISGAGSGIGREIALALGRRGFSLALLGRRGDLLEKTLAESGAEGETFPCDVTEAAAIAARAERILARGQAPTVLVPAAGTATVSPLESTPPEEFQRVLAVNLGGTFLLVRAFLPAMRKAARGWIFPLISTAGRQGFAGWSAYAASKWGVRGLVACLREELAGSGVRLVSLYPGATDTPIWEGLPGNWDRARMMPPAVVADAVCWALDCDAAATPEEIVLAPAGGDL